MNAQMGKLLGIILVVLGAGLVIWGYNMSGSTAFWQARSNLNWGLFLKL